MHNDEMIARTDSKSGVGVNRGSGVTYETEGSIASRGQAKINVGQFERVLSAVGGGLLLKRNLFNISLRGFVKMVIGAGLLRRGFTGHCNMYDSLKFNSANRIENKHPGASDTAMPVHGEMAVAVPPIQAYELWRDPANQRWIFGHFATMDAISLDRSHWKLRAPMGLEWETLIVADSPGGFLSWESLPGAGIPNEGTVRFVPMQTGGTRVIYEARFDPPGGLAMGMLKIIGFTPGSIVGKALRRFKNMAEMGLMNSTGRGPLQRGRPGLREELAV